MSEFDSPALECLVNGGLIETEPWREYEWLRQERPVAPLSGRNAYLVMRYADVRAALASPELSVEHPFRATRRTFGPTVMDVEGEKHDHIRRVFASSLQVAAINTYAEEIVEPAVQDLLGALGARRMDLIHNVAEPLPMIVVTRLVGFPAEDVDWLRTMISPLADQINHRPVPSDLVRSHHEQLASYVDGHVKERRTRGPMGLRLLEALDAGMISHDEVVANVVLLLLSGTATTTCGIANAVSEIGRRNDVVASIRSGDLDPARAIREAFRLQSPVRFTPRFARTATTVGDVRVGRGTLLQLCIASANRDPRAFEHPDEWDLSRTGCTPITFGRGIHSCLGSILATLEAAVVVKELAIRGAAVTADEDFEAGWTFRKPRELTVSASSTAC